MSEVVLSRYGMQEVFCPAERLVWAFDAPSALHHADETRRCDEESIAG